MVCSGIVIKWSSTREPVDVFKLLEAIYSEFDRIAKRRGVFKVETIGDCYGKSENWCSSQREFLYPKV